MSPDTRIAGFHAVIPAGGAGTRLWPLSRKASPKFLHDFTGSGRTLLQGTWDRLVPLAGAEGVMVVTGVRHVAAVRADLPALADDGLVAEPSPRDSMAAIGLAAAILEHRHGPKAIIGSFAADHVIVDQAGFETAVRQATAAARLGYVAVIGISPTAPSTAFGYIASGASIEGLDPAVKAVGEFVEKPDEERAGEYLASIEPRYFWNAGMFVAEVEVLLEHLAATLPEMAASLRRIAAQFDAPGRESIMAREWPGLTKIAIDYAIAEPVAAKGGVAMVPGEFDWDDVGDWDSLAGILANEHHSAVLGGESDVTVLGSQDHVAIVDSPNSVVVPMGGRLVSVLGMESVVVVDTPDALLVTTRARAQEVKSIVELLGSNDRESLT